MAIVINGSGTVTGISVGGLPDDIVDAGTLADNAVGLAQMAGGTDGNIITYDTSGNPAVVATGSSGQVLTSAGADAVPTMATLSAGKVLQVVSMVTTTATSSTSTTYADTPITLNITPAATSKVLVTVNVNGLHKRDADTSCRIRVRRGSTALAVISEYVPYTESSAYHNDGGVGFTYLDTHGADGSTAVTYTVQLRNGGGSGTVSISANGSASSMTLTEIGA